MVSLSATRSSPPSRLRREERGTGKKCSKVWPSPTSLMVLTVMFFVFSCVLGLKRRQIWRRQEQEHLYSPMLYTANHFNAPSSHGWRRSHCDDCYLPSFLGHYGRAVEGFNGMVIKSLCVVKVKSIEINKLNKITALHFMLVTTDCGDAEPQHLGMIETTGRPDHRDDLILFLMRVCHPESTGNA